MDENHPLTDFVGAFVPLRIAELEAQGGPTDDDRTRVQSYVPEFGARGESLLYRIDGVTGPMAGKLIDAIAVLAFQPGGIRIFGKRFVGNVSYGKDTER